MSTTITQIDQNYIEIKVITPNNVMTTLKSPASDEIIQTTEVIYYTENETTITNHFTENYRIISVKNHGDGSIQTTKTDRADTVVLQRIVQTNDIENDQTIIVDTNHENDTITTTTIHHADTNMEFKEVVVMRNNQVLETSYTSKQNELNQLITVTKRNEGEKRILITKLKKTDSNSLIIEESELLYIQGTQTRTNNESNTTLTLDSKLNILKKIESYTNRTTTTEGDIYVENIVYFDHSSMTTKGVVSTGEILETIHVAVPNINGNIVTTITNHSDQSYVTKKHDPNGNLLQHAITSAPDEISGDRISLITQSNGSTFTMKIYKNGVTKRLTSPVVNELVSFIGYSSVVDNVTISYDKNSVPVKTQTITINEQGLESVQENNLVTNVKRTIVRTTNKDIVSQTIEYPLNDGTGFYIREHTTNGVTNRTLHGAQGTVVSFNDPHIQSLHIEIYSQ